MNVKEIVAKNIKANGFDGLCTENCGCPTKDLMCCYGDVIANCSPGYSIPADKDGDVVCKHCGFDECDVTDHICSMKPDNRKDQPWKHGK